MKTETALKATDRSSLVRAESLTSRQGAAGASALRQASRQCFWLIAWSFFALGLIALSFALMPPDLGGVRWFLAAGTGYVLAAFPLLITRLVRLGPRAARRWMLTVVGVMGLVVAILWLGLPVVR